MQTFTGLEYLKIDMANAYGLDKESWQSRLAWVNKIQHLELELAAQDADEPLLYLKAVKAYRDTIDNIPTGHNMFLDATASGLQIMAVLSGCKKTAKHVNLINTGNREDVYTDTAQDMNMLLTASQQVTRSDIKKPHMTHWYNKKQQDTLSLDQQNAFYEVLGDEFEGAKAVMDTINNYWKYYDNEHTWTLPDNWAETPLTKDADIKVNKLKKELKCLMQMQQNGIKELPKEY